MRVVHAALMGDRLDQIKAVVESAEKSAGQGIKIQWWLFTTRDDELRGLLKSPRVHITSLSHAEKELLSLGITPVWLSPEYRQRKPTEWSLPDVEWDDDEKVKQ